MEKSFKINCMTHYFVDLLLVLFHQLNGADGERMACAVYGYLLIKLQRTYLLLMGFEAMIFVVIRARECRM